MTASKRTRAKAGQLSQATAPVAASKFEAGSPEVSALKWQLSQIAQRKVNQLTKSGAYAAFFKMPADLEAAIEELKRDLIDVPVVTENGTVTNPYQKLQSSDLLTTQDKRLIWQCLTVVREAFYRADQSDDLSVTPGYQWNMNWKHTRAEIDQVLEASKLLGLNQSQAAEAILASIFSDSVKSRKNFITHNIDGAFGAAEVLFNFVDPANSAQIRRVERICQAVREHQIAPPEFMARAATIMLTKKLKLARFDPANLSQFACVHEGSPEMRIKRDIASIYLKISTPLDKAHLVGNLHRIDFSQSERELLALIGIEEWYVPHPDNPDARIAHAVIAGDHSINYNHPEGFAKIALIRGPDTESIFEDPTVLDSLDSAVSSFADSFKVLLPEVQPMAIAGLRRTQIAVERVTAVMRELFSAVVVGASEQKLSGAQKVAQAVERAHAKRPQLFIVDNCEIYAASKECTERAIEQVGTILQQWLDKYGEIPFNKKEATRAEPGAAQLPFWNAPLIYPERDNGGGLNLEALSELQRRQFFFAARIRDIAVELLRAEQWIY